MQAASLLVAGLAVVYGLWYPDLSKALDRDIPTHEDDAVAPKAAIGDVYKNKARPLLAVAAITGLIFVPPTAVVLVKTVEEFHDRGLAAFSAYDAVSASLVLITAACWILAAHMFSVASRLRDRSSIKGDRKQG